MILLILSILFAFIFGMSFLYLLEFAQTIIFCIHSSQNADQNLINFTSWFQFAKFDLRFFTVSKLMSLEMWTTESDRMMSIQFYCQTTVLNYFNLIAVLVVWALFIYFFKKLESQFKMLQIINNLIQNMITINKLAWIFVHLLLNFLILNLAEDMLNLISHPFFCSLSLVLFTAIFIYLLLKQASILTPKFLIEVDKVNPLTFTLLTALKSIIWSLMFLIESTSVFLLLLWAIILIHVGIIFSLLLSKKESVLNHIYSANSMIITNCWFILVLLQLLWNNVFIDQSSNPKSFILLIIMFFLYTISVRFKNIEIIIL